MCRIVRLFVVVFLTACVVAGGLWERPAVAQSPNQQKLEQMDWIVGTWDHRGRTAEGQVLWVTREYKWALDRNYITCFAVVRADRQVQLVHRHMIGWDSKAGIYRSWVFSSNGNFVRGEWPEQEGDRREGKLGGLTPEGGQITADAAYVKEGDDRFVFEVRNYTVGGEAQPDITWDFARR